ncbi:MAG: hypothetical protein MJH10_14930 [Epibacterium sp.]|nr:hypothetical protein [Epibacterium sp.]NQX74816.1 hypothetical protein [Epibacterium sp.]
MKDIFEFLVRSAGPWGADQVELSRSREKPFEAKQSCLTQGVHSVRAGTHSISSQGPSNSPFQIVPAHAQQAQPRTEISRESVLRSAQSQNRKQKTIRRIVGVPLLGPSLGAILSFFTREDLLIPVVANGVATQLSDVSPQSLMVGTVFCIKKR